MITKDQVRETIKSMIEWPEGPMPDTIPVPSMEAAEILRALEIDDPEERIEWYNVTALDVECLVDLANVEFAVETCEICGDISLAGWPEDWDKFQGVLQSKLGPATINERELQVCDECFGYLDCLGQ